MDGSYPQSLQCIVFFSFLLKLFLFSVLSLTKAPQSIIISSYSYSSDVVKVFCICSYRNICIAEKLNAYKVCQFFLILYSPLNGILCYDELSVYLPYFRINPLKQGLQTLEASPLLQPRRPHHKGPAPTREAHQRGSLSLALLLNLEHLGPLVQRSKRVWAMIKPRQHPLYPTLPQRMMGAACCGWISTAPAIWRIWLDSRGIRVVLTSFCVGYRIGINITAAVQKHHVSIGS